MSNSACTYGVVSFGTGDLEWIKKRNPVNGVDKTMALRLPDPA